MKAPAHPRPSHWTTQTIWVYLVLFTLLPSATAQAIALEIGDQYFETYLDCHYARAMRYKAGYTYTLKACEDHCLSLGDDCDYMIYNTNSPWYSCSTRNVGDGDNRLDPISGSCDYTLYRKVTVTAGPTTTPTADPTITPTANPTVSPTAAPTVSPTATASPTSAPTTSPTASPTSAPTSSPIRGTCIDGERNGEETGVDCGGSFCPACPTCDDDIHNGNENGIDCGGICGPCPTCKDGKQNGDETGIDCGGPMCPDCSTATCKDGEQNGDETGIDCGGPMCPDCSASTCWTALQCSGETLEPPTPPCDQFVLVFRQLAGFENTDPDTWPSCEVSSSDCSDLDQLDELYRDTSEKFMFKMVWPDFRNSTSNPDPYTIWSQSSNPYTSTTVEDYMPIFDSTGTDTCSGLAQSQSAFARIDGNPGMPMWYCAVGTNTAWNGGIPAYNRVPAQKVEVYACADHLPK